MVEPKTVLNQIDELEQGLELMAGLMITDSYDYKFCMSKIEENMESAITKVKILVKDNGLEDFSYMDFKKRAIKAIYRAGLKRGEFDWAMAFEKKFMD